jgi:hypothetical protein
VTLPLIAIVSQCLQIMEHKNQQQNKIRQKNINVLYNNKQNNKHNGTCGSEFG